jgi:hypothetical protein
MGVLYHAALGMSTENKYNEIFFKTYNSMFAFEVNMRLSQA